MTFCFPFFFSDWVCMLLWGTWVLHQGRGATAITATGLVATMLIEQAASNFSTSRQAPNLQARFFQSVRLGLIVLA